ncbi:MAG: transcription-repair coupling factor, partial [Gammaproteobacteria bacterium]|nr:transcription-repair coupling factor [Gammaproteobacteria bacterium]
MRLPDERSGAARTVRWGQLYGSAQSLAASQVLDQHQGSICFVTESASAADTVEQEFGFFSPEVRLRRFCDYETLPYDAFSPPPELLAERLSVLYHLVAGGREAFVVNAQALLNRLPPPDFITSRSLMLKAGDRLDARALRERFVSQGYLRVEPGLDPG